MKKEFIDQLIIVEMDRVKRLHPEWPNDIIHAAAIIVQETGELMKACLDLVYFGGSERSVRNEVVSVAAMAERFMLYFPEYYEYVPRFGLDPKIVFFDGPEYDQLERLKLLDPRFKRKKGEG